MADFNRMGVLVEAEAFGSGMGILRENDAEGPDSEPGMPDSFVVITHNYAITTSFSLTPGDYSIFVHGKHDSPGPVVIGVYANEYPLGQLDYEKDNDSWEMKCLHLNKDHKALWQSVEDSNGLMTLSLHFANAIGAPQRDAAVGWVRIIPD